MVKRERNFIILSVGFTVGVQIIMDDPEKGQNQTDYSDAQKDETATSSPASLESRSHEEPPATGPQSVIVDWEPNDPEHPQNLSVSIPAAR